MDDIEILPSSKLTLHFQVSDELYKILTDPKYKTAEIVVAELVLPYETDLFRQLKSKRIFDLWSEANIILSSKKSYLLNSVPLIVGHNDNPELAEIYNIQVKNTFTTSVVVNKSHFRKKHERVHRHFIENFYCDDCKIKTKEIHGVISCNDIVSCQSCCNLKAQFDKQNIFKPPTSPSTKYITFYYSRRCDYRLKK